MTPTITFFLAALAASAAAFKNTTPLLAWSTAPNADLSTLLSTPSTNPYQNPLSAGTSPLCPTSPSSLLILSIPSLSLSTVTKEVRKEYNGVGKEGRVKSELVGEKEERAVGEVVGGWKGRCGGRIVVEEVEGGDTDEALSRNLAALPSPYLVILTPLPMEYFATLSKRQLVSALETPSDGNSTMPDPHSGLLHRYSFFSTYIIVGLAVFVGILIPAVWLGTSAVAQIETPRGLQSKMGVVLETLKVTE